LKKSLYFILLSLLSAHYSAFADVFPKSPESLGGPVLSFELLGSCEIGFSERESLLFWGGYATVFSFYELEINGGPEAAIEDGHPYLPFLTFGFRIAFKKKLRRNSPVYSPKR
jgi:hypothetical protein